MGIRTYPTKRKSRDSFKLVPDEEERPGDFDLESYLGDTYEEREEDDLTPRSQHQPPTPEQEAEILKSGFKGLTPDSELTPQRLAERRAYYARLAEQEAMDPEEFRGLLAERAPVGDGVAAQEFDSLEDYDAFKASQSPPKPERTGRETYVWPGPVGRWKGAERSPEAEKYHKLAQAAGEGYEPSGKLFSWTDPETGTLHVTGNPAEVPPTVAAEEYVTTKRRPPKPPETEYEGPLPSDEGPGMAARVDYAPTQTPGTLTDAVTGLRTAAERGAAGEPGQTQIAEAFRQREAQAAETQIPQARKRAEQNAAAFQQASRDFDPTLKQYGQAFWNASQESDIAGKMSIPLSADTDLETNLNALPKGLTFMQTMKDSWARRKTEEPGIASKAMAWADMFGDAMALGGTQQLEFDYARKLALADPEIIAYAQEQGVSGKELADLIFPEGDDYNIFSQYLKEGRGMPDWMRYAMPGVSDLLGMARRTQEGFVQDHWREAYKEHPDLVNAIARKTRGALESGMAWEHFNEQGTAKGLAEGFATDPMLIGTLAVAGISGGLSVSSKVASKAGALRAASALQKAAGTVSKARVVFEPLETAVGAGLKQAARGVRAATPGVRKAASKVWPGAEYGIKRAVWKAADEGVFGHSKLARMLTMLDDADKVVAQMNKGPEGMRAGLEQIMPVKIGLKHWPIERAQKVANKLRSEAAGLEGRAAQRKIKLADNIESKIAVIKEEISRGGAKIEGIATRVQKMHNKKPFLSSKGVRDADTLFAGVKGKPLAKKPLVKNGELTPLGKVVVSLDTGKGLDALTDAEKVVAGTLRKTFDKLKAKMPEDVGRIEHYFPRYKPLGKRVKQVEASRQAIGKELTKFWEEAREANIPAIELYEDYEDVIQAVGRRLSAQDVAEVDKEINALIAGLVKEFEGVKTTEKVVAGYKVAPTVELSGKPHSIEEAKRIARIQAGKGTDAGTAAAERIEKRIAEAEPGAKIISKQKKGAAAGRIEKLRPEAKLLKKQLGAADKEIKGLEIPKRRTEKLKTRIERLKAEKAEATKGIRDMAEGTEKAKRREAWRLANERLKKAEADLGAIQPTAKDIIEPDETRLLSKIDDLTEERDRIFRGVLDAQADDAIDEARTAKLIEAARKKVAALDLEHAKIQAALPPERELEQLAKRLDISYKDRDKLAKDLAAKRKKLREYWDTTQGKPVYKEKPIDAGKEFAKFVRAHSVANTELDTLEKLHYKLLLRPFKTTMLGWRPSYALRNMQTAIGRTVNEMLNGVLEGEPWMPSFSKASRDLMHIDKEFIMQAMGSRNIPTTSRGLMGKIPHFVYSLEGGADRLFKGGATLGKVEAEIGRLARLNKVATVKRPIREIVEELQQKGAITDFADLVRTKGIEEANRIYFNFQERIGLMIGIPGQIFPFAEWGYKNFNYVMKDLVRHPWKLRAWKIGYDQWAQQYQDHPEYSRHVARLTKDGPLKYFNHLFTAPLWGVGGFQPLMPFLEGTSAYDKHAIEMFEPVLERIMDRAKAESLSHEDREKLINSESGRLGFKGAGSLRGYLDKNYIAGPQTGYRHNKHAIKEILDIVAQNLSLGPTAQWAMSRVGMAKFEGNRMFLGWQNVVEDLGLAKSGTKWIEFLSERKGEYYNRKVKQEMDRQKLRGEMTDRRKAEIDVGLRRALIHTVNNILPLSMRFIPPEDLEKLAIMETRRRALKGQPAISETSPHDVMAHQLETGKDYPAAKFDVEAQRAQKANDYSRVREVGSGGGELVALVPARLSTKSEEIEAMRVNAAVNAVASAPDGERAQRLEAYGLEGVVLSDSSKPARKRLGGDYYERMHKFIVATAQERRAMVEAGDAEIQMFELGTKGFDFGAERVANDAKQYVSRLAADAIAAGDRDAFEQKLAGTDIEALVTQLPDGQQFMNDIRSKVMKGARTAPDSLRTHIRRISELTHQGAAESLISYTNGLSNEEVSAVKDHLGEGNYKQMLDDAKEIAEYNKADELFKRVMSAEDKYRAYNDLNTRDQNLIDKWFPENDLPEWVATEKKHKAEQAENDEWKRKIADSNYDVRMRKMVPIDVKRRLGNEHQFWFDFFYPVELTLAQKELQAERKAKEKKLEGEREKRKVFLADARKWKDQILESKFDGSFKGSRVPMEVKRYLADKDPRFEKFFFGKSIAGSGGGRGKRSYPHTAKARASVSPPARFRPAQTGGRRPKIVPTARGQKRTDAFRRVAAEVGKPK